MTARRSLGLALAGAIVVALGAAGYKYRDKAVSIVSAEEPPVPTTRVTRGALEMNVHATWALRAVQATLISAPAVGGNILRLVTMVETGAQVQKGDVIMEFDPTEQQYQLEQAQLDLAEADQNVAKMRADNCVDRRIPLGSDLARFLKNFFLDAECDVFHSHSICATVLTINRPSSLHP